MMIKGAVIGVGYLGHFHAQKFKALSSELGFEFVGVCDANATQAQKVATELGVRTFSQAEELLGQVQFVTIATSTPHHYKLARQFLSHGIHVNVEKPMTVTVAEAEELVALARKNSLRLAVGHSERFSPVLSALQQNLQEEKPLYLDLQRHAPYKARGAEVSVVLDLMIHDLDLMLSMDTSAVELLSSSKGCLVANQNGQKSEDWAQAQFKFKSGLLANISVSRVASQMTRTMKVVTEKKSLLGNFQTGELEISSPVAEGMKFDVLPVGRGDNLLLETKNFVLAIQGKAELCVTGEQGLRAMQLAQEILNK